MAYGNIWLFLIITTAACSTQAQQQQWLGQKQKQLLQYRNVRDPHDFMFPGPSERPDRYPINPQETTRRPQGQGSASNEPATTSSPNIACTTPSAAYTRCFYNCLSTSEYNPVCGTDNIVYSNPGRLTCAQSCGKQVQKRKDGQCTYNMRGQFLFRCDTTEVGLL